MEQLKIVIVGHVDHGKSTLIGRLFHDTGSLPEGRLEQLQQVAARRGFPFEWANLMDSLQSERDQNITIDTSQIWFCTRKRQYVLIDAPGHKEFLKNMVTGAAHAEAALLLIDASEGVQEQSRRHGYLLNLLGIGQVAVLVNKMDLAAYSQSRFSQIEHEFRDYLKALGLQPQIFIPVAAKPGDNVSCRSANMPWWSGPTVLEILDQFKVPEPAKDQPLRFPIQDVYRFDKRRVLVGRVESGTLKTGQRLIFCPGQKTGVVKSIERWKSFGPSDVAEAGESVGITMAEQIFVERGFVAASEDSLPYQLNRFKARIFWMGKAPFSSGKVYKLKIATQELDCQLDSVEKRIDASTLASIGHPAGPFVVARHEVAEVYLRTQRPVVFDLPDEIRPTGRFVIVDEFTVAGGGIILEDNYPQPTSERTHKSQNIFWMRGKVSPQERSKKYGHSGRIVWLTGFSGAGKSTIAMELERELFSLGKLAYVLDGDNIRHGLCSDLAFSPKDRKENIRRIGEVAKLFADAGIICITAFISPYRSDRDAVRRTAKPGQFVEVYVNAPLTVCEKRDAKGLYAKARANQIHDFTGISAPYEEPLKPELVLHTDELSVQESVTRILEYLLAPKSEMEASI